MKVISLKSTATVPSLKRIICSFAVLLWSAGIACGVAYTLVYQFTPTESAVVANHWPTASSCKLALDRPTLVMFVHPRCPCSRASLHELAILMTRFPRSLDVQLLFIKPPAVATDWTCTDLWAEAAEIPGVVQRIDDEGTEQHRFGARVSGEVFVYLPSGNLLFHGGITAGRGHEGDNAGRATLESLLLQDEHAVCVMPVFGCELNSPRRGSAGTAAADQGASDDTSE